MIPSKQIEELARKRLEKEKEKGAYLFTQDMHFVAFIEAIIDFLDIKENSLTEVDENCLEISRQSIPTRLTK